MPLTQLVLTGREVLVDEPVNARNPVNMTYLNSRLAWVSSVTDTMFPGGSVGVNHASDASYNRTTSVIGATGADDSIGCLLNFDSNLVDTSWYGMAFTASGNAAISSAQTKFGAKSLLLDGTGDYITANESMPYAALGGGNFSFDMWFRTASLSAQQTLIDWRPSGTNGAYPVLYITATTGQLKYQTASTDRITSASGSITTGTWHHVAMVRNGGVTTMYLNGSAVNTWTDATLYLTPPTLRIGANNGGINGFNGHIDEVRIEPGNARWTTGFSGSLPSAAHTPSYVIGQISSDDVRATYYSASTTFQSVLTNRTIYNCACRVGNVAAS